MLNSGLCSLESRGLFRRVSLSIAIIGIINQMRARGLLSLIVIAVFMFVSVFLPINQTNAQSSSGSLNLTTSPLPINLLTNPGETVTTDLRIRNSGTETERLQVGLLKFGPNDTTGQPKLMDREPGDDYFDWVSFSEDIFTAEPNVWHTIKMTIDTPPEAALGYYYAVTFQRAADANPEEGAALHGGTAILVLLEVYSPNAKRQMEIAEFASLKSVYEFLPAEFNVTLKNTGNIHFIPSGSIFITKGSEQIAVLPINEARGNILPDSARTFTAAWDDGFPRYEAIVENNEELKNEDGTPKRSLKWDLSRANKLRWGKYKATLLAVYDDGQKDVPLEAVLTFWVIPWRIIFVLVLMLALLVAGLYLILKNVFKWGKKSKKPVAKEEKSDS